MNVVVFAPDLGDRTRIAAALPDAVFVRRAQDLVDAAAGADVVVVDLSRPGVFDVLDAVVAGAGRVVAFGPHVGDALDGAAAAGAVGVPRSRFFRDVSAVVQDPEP